MLKYKDMSSHLIDVRALHSSRYKFSNYENTNCRPFGFYKKVSRLHLK